MKWWRGIREVIVILGLGGSAFGVWQGIRYADRKQTEPYPRQPFTPYRAGEARPGLEELLSGATDDEQEAMKALQEKKYARARELVEIVLKKNSESLAGRYVLAKVLAEGEGSLPKGLFEIRRLRHAVEKPGRADDKIAREWYALALESEGSILGDLDRREELLLTVERREQLGIHGWFQTQERLWSLVKLKRWEEADREIAATKEKAEREIEETKGQYDEEPYARYQDALNTLYIALNSKSAMEFERRNRRAAYDAGKALRDKFPTSGLLWFNFGESAMVSFRLAEAETSYKKSTQLYGGFNGTAWRELAVLYLTQGRFPETKDALKKAKKDRAKRDPHTLQQDQAAYDTVLAAFLIALGRNADAERVARKVYERPDRAGSTSADVRLLDLHGAMLLFVALTARVEQEREREGVKSWLRRTLPNPSRKSAEWELWTLRQKTMKLLMDEVLLVEAFRPYLWGQSAIGSWLFGTVAHLLPAGVAAAALERARKADSLPEAEPYFDAMEAEVQLRLGNARKSLEFVRRALDRLEAVQEKLFRARICAVGAEAADRLGDPKARQEFLATVLRDFPAVLRLLSMKIPVSIRDDGSPAAMRLAELLHRSPRLERRDDGFLILLSTNENGLCFEMRLPDQSTCFLGATPLPDPSEAAWLAAFDAFNDKLMSPTIDLNQADINSLDGSPAAERGREKLDGLLRD